MKEIRPPFIIGPSLEMALEIEGVFVSLVSIRNVGERQSAAFRFIFPDGKEEIEDSLRSGTLGFSSEEDAFSSLLSFLGYCGEAQRYSSDSDAKSLFSPRISSWAADVGEGFSILEYEINGEEN